MTDHFCWISLLFNLTGRGLKEEKMVRGARGEGRLFKEGD